ERLRDMGVRTTEQLIEQGSTSAARLHLADQTGTDEAKIGQWVHQADLLRIAGIGPELAHLLCQVGVSTVPKLAYRSTERLYEDLSVYARRVHKVAALPSQIELHGFGVVAKRLPKLVRH
ncbi:MAG: DUF4332 domain-containing protein, partial [Candidatus Saccharimonas sp.]